MGYWENGVYYLSGDGRIPTLTQNEIDNISCDFNSVFKNKSDGLLYRIDENNVIMPLGTDFVPKTVYISKSGNDATGKIENSKQHFATFMGAYNALPNNALNWTIEYLRSDVGAQFNDEAFYENDIELYRAGEYMSVTIVIPTHIAIYSNSSDDKPTFGFSVFTGNIRIDITGGGSIYRTGSPTTTTNCYAVSIYAGTIKNMGTIRSIVGRGAYIGHYIDFDDIDIIQSDVTIGAYCQNTDLKLRNTTIKSLTDIGMFTDRLYSKSIIDHCTIDSELDNIISWGLQGTIKNSKFITNNGNTNIKNASYLQRGMKVYDCEFINNNPNPSVNITSAVYDISIIEHWYNCRFWKKDETLPNMPNPGLVYPVELTNITCNVGIGLCTETSEPSEYNYYVQDLGAIAVGDVYDIWMGRNYGFREGVYHRDSGGATGTLNPYFKQLSYTVQSGDTEVEIIDNLLALWNAEVLANNQIFLGQNLGFTVSAGYETINSLNRYVLKIVANSIYDMLPREYNYSKYTGMRSEHDNLYLDYTKLQAGYFNVLDVNNINKTIVTHKNMNKDYYALFGELKEILP